MRELEVAKVDVFAEEPLSGNPAGVVFAADELDDVEMHRVASELGPPVTVFVLRSRKADVRLRFFSQAGEEPLSGHGALGALWCLASQKAILGAPGTRHRAETLLGILPFSLEVGPEGPQMVWLTQKKPLFANVGDFKEVASALGIGAEALFKDEFPLARASTGLPCLLVPIRSLDVLQRLEPRFDEVLAVSEELDVGGIMAFTWNVVEPGSTAHARFLTPHSSIREDPGNGLAAGALAAYFAEHEFIPRESFDRIVIEQGHWIGRPCRMLARIDKKGATVRKVEVGGSARISLHGRLRVP